MKTKVYRNQIITFMIIAIIVLGMISIIAVNTQKNNLVFAEEKVNLETSSTIVNVVSCENVISFAEYNIQPAWLSFEPRIGWTKDKKFTILSFADQAITYYLGSGTHVFGGYVNEELFSVTGVDNSGSSYRLEPVNGLDQPNNINAVGSATISFNKLRDPRGTCVFSNDSSKLNSLTSGFYVNSTTKVGNGKILYRSSNGTTFGAWSFVNLNDGATLSFTAKYVQIAVIYELNEKGRFILDTDIHYYIAGIYRFNIS